MTAFGLEAFVFDDSAEETYNLLLRLASSLPSVGNDELLLAHFNDDSFSTHVIVHLKVCRCEALAR